MVRVCIKEQWSSNFSFLMVGYCCPLHEPLTMGSLPWTSLKYSPPMEAADLWLCKSTFLVTLGHSDPYRCVAHHNPLYLSLWLFFFYKIKNAFVAQIINPHVTWLNCACLCSCLLLTHSLGKETKVLNVPFCKSVNSTESE